ncbi:MAG: hypothetical protein AAGM22_27580 [Acidobacteriota bacterium]
MKRAAFVVCLLFATVLAFGATAEDSAASAERTLVGEYHWNQGYSGDLKAVFTPDGENQWNVSFFFDFRSEPHEYSGTATGSLDGKLEGTVKNESKRRSFTFEGSFKEGQFEGNHAETTPGRNRRTGTLTLK